MRRINKAREQLDDGRTIYCVTVEFPEPRLVEYAGYLGFDMVHVDGEHHGVSPETCYHLVRAADAAGMSSMVRVPVNTPDVMMAYAETGVDIITAPHVRTVQDAQDMIQALHFPPRGTRGLSGYSRASHYGARQQVTDYYADIENRTMPMALLEDAEAYDNIEALAAVEGLQIYALGLSDLSASLGIPGQVTDPQVLTRRDRAMKVLADHGKVVALSSNNISAQQEYARAGVQIVMSSIRAIIEQGAEQILAARLA